MGHAKMRRRIIAICGPSGGGKSFLVGKFNKYQVVHTDDFYIGKSHMRPNDKGVYNFDSPEAVDLQSCAEAVIKLATLSRGTEVEIPQYDMKTSERCGKSIIITPDEDAMIIIDGIFSFHPPLLELSDFRIFVEAPEEIILARRYRRDIRERGRTPHQVLEQYPTVIKGYEQYIKPMKQFADLILDNGVLV